VGGCYQAAPLSSGDRSLSRIGRGSPPDTPLVIAATEQRRGHRYLNRSLRRRPPIDYREQSSITDLDRSQDIMTGVNQIVQGRPQLEPVLRTYARTTSWG